MCFSKKQYKSDKNLKSKKFLNLKKTVLFYVFKTIKNTQALNG